jgi:hypothetical protein
MNDDEIIRQRVDDRSAARAHCGGPPILVITGGWRGKLMVAEELATGLRWPFEAGKALHPQMNIAKTHAGILLIRRLAASVRIGKSVTPG